MTQLDDEKKLFIEEAKKLSGAAYNMLNLWDGELQDALHGSPKILEAYSRAFSLSFDEWWHAFSDFIDTVETELIKGKTYVVQLSVTLKPGDQRTAGNVDDLLRGMFDEVNPESQGLQLGLGAVVEYHG